MNDNENMYDGPEWKSDFKNYHPIVKPEGTYYHENQYISRGCKIKELEEDIQKLQAENERLKNFYHAIEKIHSYYMGTSTKVYDMIEQELNKFINPNR